jgi:hypothetical protein
MRRGNRRADCGGYGVVYGVEWFGAHAQSRRISSVVERAGDEGMSG